MRTVILKSKDSYIYLSIFVLLLACLYYSKDYFSLYFFIIFAPALSLYAWLLFCTQRFFIQRLGKSSLFCLTEFIIFSIIIIALLVFLSEISLALFFFVLALFFWLAWLFFCKKQATFYIAFIAMVYLSCLHLAFILCDACFLAQLSLRSG